MVAPQHFGQPFAKHRAASTRRIRPHFRHQTCPRASFSCEAASFA
ncbi:MAG: hypothetical protein M5U26_23130 [Planctomycetota bacterium]|nr:hypothetical protein [Planctomycetota bacterium]